DWSSDVCSSDLGPPESPFFNGFEPSPSTRGPCSFMQPNAERSVNLQIVAGEKLGESGGKSSRSVPTSTETGRCVKPRLATVSFRSEGLGGSTLTIIFWVF